MLSATFQVKRGGVYIEFLLKGGGGGGGGAAHPSGSSHERCSTASLVPSRARGRGYSTALCVITKQEVRAKYCEDCEDCEAVPDNIPAQLPMHIPRSQWCEL